MCHDYNTTHDQIAAGGGPGSPAPGARSHSRLFLQVLAEGFHPAPALRPAGPQNLPENRLPRAGPNAGGLPRAARRPRLGQTASLFHPLQSRTAALKKGEATFLLIVALVRAQDRGLIDERPEAAID